MRFHSVLSRLPAILLLAGSVSVAAAQSADPVWVSGSSQKVCQLIGETDHQTMQPTVSQTETNYGLSGNDLGSLSSTAVSCAFIFGDTQPTATFNGGT